ncbi:MAG: patatin-like phospholipase family protein, partial [Roseibium sp.]|nr:patatin-like phospholipase family protein [Roseibium sp.]
MGNPPLYPLFYETATPDVILIQINPLERRQVPRTAREIVNRLNEITFNSTLLRELRAIDFVTRLIEEGKLSSDEYMRVFMHRISATELKPLQASSKMNAEWAFLTELKDLGRATARNWLKQHYGDIGERSTINLRNEFS